MFLEHNIKSSENCPGAVVCGPKITGSMSEGSLSGGSLSEGSLPVGCVSGTSSRVDPEPL